MLFEGHVVFDEWLEIFTVVLHVVDRVLPVTVVVAHVALHLVSQRSEQAVAE